MIIERRPRLQGGMQYDEEKFIEILETIINDFLEFSIQRFEANRFELKKTVASDLVKG